MNIHGLLKPVRYVFYRILAWKLRDLTESTPVLVAGFATTLLLLLNCLLVVMGANGARGEGALLPKVHFGLFHYLMGAIFFIALSNLMASAWVANGNLVKLQSEFAVGTPHRQLVCTALFWAYVIGSPLAPLGLAIFWHAAHT